MPTWRHVSTIVVILAAVALAAPSVRAQSLDAPAGGLEAPIGKVMSVSGSATIEHSVAVVLQANVPGGVAQTKTGDFVYTGDVVQTGTDGKLAIAFSDGSAFNLSSNARMVLDKFIYDPKSTSNSTLISLTKGNFTFVAGAIAKTGDMKVDTPVGTMGIRGTTPHVEISNDGGVKFSTLVEGKKDAATTAPRAPQQNKVIPGSGRQRQAKKVTPPNMTPEQAASYNRLLNFNAQICQNC
jgi:hypothetical protein